jgi:nucleoside-diphosphate-sugar epimerase
MPVNIGNPEEHTILEFAETILREIGVGSKIVLRNDRNPVIFGGGNYNQDIQ